MSAVRRRGRSPQSPPVLRTVYEGACGSGRQRVTESGTRPKPFGASIFDNWMKRRTALHDTGRESINLTQSARSPQSVRNRPSRTWRTSRETRTNQNQERKNKDLKPKSETKEKACGLTLTERQIEDFTRLAQLQKDGAANIKDRRLITDAYRAFAAENEEALSAEGGVRAGRLKVWIEVTRAIHAAIVE